MITITEKAVNKIIELLEKEFDDEAADYRLRIAVRGGGCSGLENKLSFMHKESIDKNNDQSIESNGVSVIVDNKSLLYLVGSILDYKDGLDGSGFSIFNKHFKNQCGCGSSFSL